MQPEHILSSLTFASNGIAQIRWIKDDGGYHRETREPGADVSDLPSETRAAIAVVWTPAVIAAYAAAREVE